MTRVDGIVVATEGPRPFYLPVFQAHIRLIEDGKPPTCVNLAKELGVTKQAVSKMQLRHPDLGVWITRQFAARSGQYAGQVLTRCAFLGIQGSVAHAELYLKATGTAPGFVRGPGTGDPVDPGNTMVVNLLVPRPEYPQGALPALAAVKAPVVQRPDIPTLNLGPR